MKQATRRLLAIRYGSQYVPRVTLKPSPTAKKNQCHLNALDEAKRTGWQSEVACGWIVTPYSELAQCSGAMFHYWNVDSDGNHYDTSPMGDMAYDYVMDSDVHYESMAYSKTISEDIWFSPPSLKFYHKSKQHSFAFASHEANNCDAKWISLAEKPITITELMMLCNHFNPFCDQYKIEDLV